MRRFLLYSSVGMHSRHRTHWLARRAIRNFDVCLYDYSGGGASPDSGVEYYFSRRGTKFQNFQHFLKTHGRADQYDVYFVLDDDIEIKTHAINALFEKVSALNLDLAQPAFTWRSYISHPITRRVPGVDLRYTNFVENNAVLFSRKSLGRLQETFEKSVSGYGLDLVWPKVLGYPENKIAIVDSIPAHHPWRVLRFSSLDGVLPRKSHEAEGLKLMKSYGLRWREWKDLFREYHAVGSGRTVIARNKRTEMRSCFDPGSVGRILHGIQVTANGLNEIQQTLRRCAHVQAGKLLDRVRAKISLCRFRLTAKGIRVE